jgi:hypothetical protein
MIQMLRNIIYFVSVVTLLSTAWVPVHAKEMESSAFTVAYRITEVKGYERYRVRSGDVELNLSGTGSLNTFNQREKGLREAQQLHQQEEIYNRTFRNNRTALPRATEAPKDTVDNAKLPSTNRRAGRNIRDPRLYLQELRESKQVDRTTNNTLSEPEGPCAGLTAGRLAQCRYVEQKTK